MVILHIFLALSQVSSIYLEQQLDSVMTMGWDIDQVNSEIKITLKCKITLGYCSVGLRKTMRDCDMFAALVESNTVTIKDYWSRNHNTPLTDIREGGTEDYEYVSGGVDANGEIDVTFKRKLDTGDEFDQTFDVDVTTQICWGYKDNRRGWTEHSDYDDARFAWATTAANMEFQKSSEDAKNHGIIMSIAWALFAVVGIAAARYFKQYWWWFPVHFILLLLSSIATILTSLGMYEDDQYAIDQASDDTFLHSRVGIILSSLVIAQVIFGSLTSYFKIFTKNANATILLNRSHKAVGYALFIAGLYNCWVGWDLYGSMGKAAIGIGFILTIIFFGILETVQIFYLNKLSAASPSLPEMTHFKAMELIKEGRKLMFADDLVIDVKLFSFSHPGGSYMLSESIGEDTGKYMVGCSSFSADLNPYDHSAKAFSMLKSLAIARIPYPINYMRSLRKNDNSLMEFYIRDKKVLNVHTNLLYLKSDDWAMNRTCDSIDWLGKHFMTVYKKKLQYVKRYYSSIFVDIVEWGNELGISSTNEVMNEDGNVKLIYKVYDGGKMTNHLNNLKNGEIILLKGPIGPGLMLQELKGKFLALAGGTGLVPFLDLVHKAWKTFGAQTEVFKLSLFVFFREWKDGFGLDILEKIKQNCGWLDLQIVTNQHSNKKGITEEVRLKAKENPDLTWICGPSGFNRFYFDMMIESGLNRNKVILM